MKHCYTKKKKKLKVIMPEKTLPLVVSPPVPTHITAVVTICASGI